MRAEPIVGPRAPGERQEFCRPEGRAPGGCGLEQTAQLGEGLRRVLMGASVVALAGFALYQIAVGLVRLLR